jgi:DNA polymerase-1
MKLAMLRIHRQLRDHGLRSRMVLQVHDELLFEAPESEVTQLASLVIREMEQVVTLRVPLVVEAKVGPTWADLEPLRIKLAQ